MWPFSRKNDTDGIVTGGEVNIEKVGCTAHHFGEYEPTSDHRVEVERFLAYNGQLFQYDYHTHHRLGLPDHDFEPTGAYVIERKHKRKCQHQGCHETSEKWERHAILPPDDMDSVGYSDDEFLELVEEVDDD